jgi:hypothetical protein
LGFQKNLPPVISHFAVDQSNTKDGAQDEKVIANGSFV